MKIQTMLRRPFAMRFVLVSTLTISSCEKNDVDESGTASLKIVNASQSSGEQNFYLVNNAIVSTGLGYTETFGYVSTNSGNRLVAEFRDKETNIKYADGELWMGNGESYTVFLADEGVDARVKLYEDKLSTPPKNIKVLLIIVAVLVILLIV